jgi:hypothetical protein
MGVRQRLNGSMKTFVEFRSDKFPAYEGEEEKINPGLWGRRLAEYFVERLPKQGVNPERIIHEDWGYYIPVKTDGPRLAICCGHQNGDDDEFWCFTEQYFRLHVEPGIEAG